MAKGRKTYAPEYRQRLVEMARAGRSAESLARDFEPTAQTIRNWGVAKNRPMWSCGESQGLSLDMAGMRGCAVEA
jgi:transposase